MQQQQAQQQPPQQILERPRSRRAPKNVPIYQTPTANGLIDEAEPHQWTLHEVKSRQRFVPLTQLLDYKQGEVFLCSTETQGCLEVLPIFKGKYISSLGGGFNKLFILQDTEENEGIVSSLHPPEYDEFDFTSHEKNFNFPVEKDPDNDSPHENEQPNIEDPFEYVTAFDDKGSISEIKSGRRHLIIRTEAGKLYTYGIGEFGALGLGGTSFSRIPRILKPLADKKVVQVACGEYHNLALTDLGDVYAWGRGFEGQLGISKSVQTSSTPRYIKTFFDHPVKYICCGAFHSIAITNEGKLYAWGEAKTGQCGLGKMLKVELPTEVPVTYQNVPKPMTTEIIHTRITLRAEGNGPDRDVTVPVRFKKAAAGYGHTIALSEDGELYGWGFNVKGQIGIGRVMRKKKNIDEDDFKKRPEDRFGDLDTVYKPTFISSDILGNALPKFYEVACGYYSSFAIDELGALWSWGGGSIGHKDERINESPRRVDTYTENRKFTKMLCGYKTSVFFAPIRVISMLPKSGPSSGGTILSLLGTGFTETDKMMVKFVYGDGKFQRTATCKFNQTSEAINCITPRFDDLDETENIWPQEIEVQLTFDGINFIPAEEKYFVYSAGIQTISMNPRYASVHGGTKLIIDLNIDDKTAENLDTFTIGFQAKQLIYEGGAENQHQDDQDPGTGKSTQRKFVKKEAVNPLSININSPELEKENWICVRGIYHKQKVICTIPRINDLHSDTLFFNVDISLNGQQFSGSPSSFRFYDIQIETISPDGGPSEGGTTVKIIGTGFFDSETKNVKIVSRFGDRLRGLDWNKNEKCYEFKMPPLSWLFGGNSPTPEQEAEVKTEGVNIYLTLNGIEWFDVGTFYFYDADYERIISANFDAKLSEEDRKNLLMREEPEVDPFANCKNEAEVEKKKVELNKIMQQEDDEIKNLFKKAGDFLYLKGQNFIKSPDIVVQFIYENKGTRSKEVYWKNNKRIAVVIPDIEDLEYNKIYPIRVEISYNGQDFSTTGKGINYLALDKDLTPAEKQKIADEELKKLKKGGKK